MLHMRLFVIFRSICWGVAAMIATLFAWLLGYFVLVKISASRSYPHQEVGVDVVSLIRNNYGTIDAVAFAAFVFGFALAYRYLVRRVPRP